MNGVVNMKRKDGLSGILRAKNEAIFIEASIDSCIDALDELIVVYNDCTDETPVILERKRKQYPDKLKVYSYNHHILSHNLTQEEFLYAIHLPEDSNRLHSSQCNYALSKVTYKYAVKIDPDQLYFTDELKGWRDICSGICPIRWKPCFILGWLFMMYISFYRRLSLILNKPCLMMLHQRIVDFCKSSYSGFAKWQLKRGKAAITLSGVNLFWDGAWYVPFDGRNIHPPYNGEGDHLIFRLSKETFFSRYYINKPPYNVIEMFHHPYKVMFANNPVWFHQHANRAYCWEKVKKMKDEHPELFVPIEKFVGMTYEKILGKLNPHSHTLYQRTLFALVHKLGVKTIMEHTSLLNRIKVGDIIATEKRDNSV